MAHPAGFPHSAHGVRRLRGKRDDFGAFHFQNLLIVEPWFKSCWGKSKVINLGYESRCSDSGSGWRTQQDSNLQSPASEADALSSCAMGACFTTNMLYHFKGIFNNCLYIRSFTKNLKVFCKAEYIFIWFSKLKNPWCSLSCSW